ncbi:MarR family winged helix-turn-helix transcriptional regulator [uncultured Nocardioides sp.]|uniref:MarR family winged helix-turn-helix transcriptional regulator n=1 Tax=uncultured Nocardioides sp. TaxID=198441 RepID=UPI0025D7C231|nr:MarR family winged helix-turn-helix transcriptional regulator [uncultured Nocardioides sp.]
MERTRRTPDQPGPGDPDSVVGWTLVRAYHRVAPLLRAVLGQAGLSPHQFGVLVQLSVEPDISQAALARRILITPQSMGAVLRQMEAAGLVSLSPSAGRGVPRPARLTDDGRRVLARTYPRVRELNAPESLGLTAEEARTLNRLLHRVHDHLGGS